MSTQKRRRLTSGPPAIAPETGQARFGVSAYEFKTECKYQPLEDSGPPEKNTVILGLKENKFRKQLADNLSRRGYDVVTADDAQDILLKLIGRDPSKTLLVL